MKRKNFATACKLVLSVWLCTGLSCSSSGSNSGANTNAGAGAGGSSAGSLTNTAGANSGAGGAGSSSGGSSTSTAGSATAGFTPGGSAGDAASGGTGAGSSGAGSAGVAGMVEPSNALGFASNRVIVTGVRGTTTPAAQAAIQLHNGGGVAAEVLNLAIGGADQALFELASPPAFPVTIAPGADLTVKVQMLTTGSALPARLPEPKTVGTVVLNGALTATLSSGTTSAKLYGLVLDMANYEPTLGQLLTTLGYSLDVGKAQNNWNPNTSMNAVDLPGVEAGSDEVAAQRFVKAGTGSVGMTLVARFSPVGALPYGWYDTTTGCPAGCTTIGTMSMISDAQTSDKARMVYPPLAAGSATEFDPGNTPFGIWIYSDQKTQQFNEGGNTVNGDWDYSEDALNAPANVHRFKSYPLRGSDGSPISHSYLVAVEEAGNGDYQDYVFVLSNVTAMP